MNQDLRDHRKRGAWTPLQLALLFGLSILNIVQGLSLVRRVTKGATDFTVFYNTGVLLRKGAGAMIYAGKDQSTEWLRTIPPFGQLLVHPLTLLSVRQAGFCWSLFNLGVLAASAVMLSQIWDRLDSRRRLMGRLGPAICLVLLALAPGSMQVGQYSVFFVGCWILYLRLRCSRFGQFAEAALAVPAAIKLYPVLFAGVAALQRDWKRFCFFFGWVFVAAILPGAIYGPRTDDLTISFWNHAIMSSSGRMAESQRARSASNQGLDSIALRYLTADQPLHRRFPMVPHAGFETDSVIKAVNLLRVAVLVISLGVGFYYVSRPERTPLWDTVVLMALFSATMYLLLPGAKSRYAVYELFAFIPLMVQSLAAKRLGMRALSWAWSAVVVISVLLVITFLPPMMRAFGFGFMGSVVLWTSNLMLILGWSKRTYSRAAVPENLAAAAAPQPVTHGREN